MQSREIQVKDQEELQKKEAQLNSLLLLTEAINDNVNALELYNIYQDTLERLYGIQEVILVHNQGKTWKIYKEQRVEIKLEDYIEDITQYDKLEEKQLLQSSLYQETGYSKVITVRHKERAIAYLLFKGEEISIETYGRIKTLTNIIAVAIENKRLFREQLQAQNFLKEREIARQVQQMMIPQILPTTPEIQFSTKYRPHSEVSGDYYDFIQLDEKQVLFCIADVAGKGVPAALLMANIQANLRRLVINFKGLERLINELNETIYSNTQGERFVTMFVATYDIYEDELCYINAGHNAPILRRERKIELLKVGSTVLGAVPKLPKTEKGKIKIKDPVQLIMYTDGVTETKNKKGELLGEKGLYKIIEQNKHIQGAEEMNTCIETAVQRYAEEGDIKDDITLFTCNINPKGIEKGET